MTISSPDQGRAVASAVRVSRSGGYRLSPVMVEGSVRCVEFALVTAAGAFAYIGHAPPQADIVVQPLRALLPLLAIPALAAAWLALAHSLNGLTFVAIRTPERVGLLLGLAWATLFGLLALANATLALDPAALQAVILQWALVGLLGVAAERLVLGAAVRMLCRRGTLSRRTAIVGGGPYAEALMTALAGHSQAELEIVGLFDDRADDRSPDLIPDCPKLGTVDDLVAFARHTPIDLVIFTLPISAEQRLLMMLRKLWVLPVDIRLAAHAAKLRFRSRAYSYIGPVPVLDIFDRPVADWDFIVKSVFDRVVGALCLAAAAPVMLAVAIAVKVSSPGPILFRQQRYGFNNQSIEVFKFRSMYVDTLDFDAAKSVTRSDPRVTRVGRIIRKTSLDELPQLFNVVFKGNLSLVGPRPHAIRGKAENRLYDEVVDGYFARHRVVPGITGWAQVNGWRGETDTAEKIQKRVECDLHYIENWSIGFDLYILAATLFALCNTKNAY